MTRRISALDPSRLVAPPSPAARVALASGLALASGCFVTGTEGVSPQPDTGVFDGGIHVPDAGPQQTDAFIVGLPPLDTAVWPDGIVFDGGIALPDADTTGSDGGAVAPDADTTVFDGGIVAPDADTTTDPPDAG